MFQRITIASVVALAVLAFLLSGDTAPEPREPHIQGRNGTVLFIANNLSGLANVHIAAASALLEGYPHVEVHYASFPGPAAKLSQVSSYARAKNPAVKEIIFHQIKGQSFQEAVESGGYNMLDRILPPGVAGLGPLTADMQRFLSPWSVEDHLEVYHELGALIDEVDPAVVVLDIFVAPGIEAARNKNRQHALLSPNTVLDHFMDLQPHGSMLWKYPA